ncbi:alanine or glycine:cation symporter, AGCS family [Xylanibacter ruminicola]|jgi:AGCS family alanine or glycine:cation symporter|uniref:Alanine or glycine:cation symporter, AGCS family n=1 Tax=Xylanibacter ruminicola TaxID=839 RepID=A0A1M7I894_XYLRU|nr:alanine/glycine:cation symporter family protein [Xylanibacter ruminicola]SFB77726.1 alanine or glycine:cation symporter, AGCS family [Xylanibacter ruminicola]SHM36964.1 alanine or glycine:cation symporter, AGCS family [Xylanibacter ruminicola]
MNELITQINDAVWGYVLIAALVGCGVWFTIKTRFVQFRMVGEMIRLLTDSAVDTVGDQVKNQGAEGKRKHISSFQAFAVSVATRVGTGNLAGVASAIAIGGPGAVFWMWIIALIGSATAFVESTLAQLFKQKHKDSFIGGPAYYIQRGLHQRWMAVTFAVLITLQFGLSNNSVQANTICGAMNEAFGWNPAWVGAGLAAIGLFIVFGGIQRIAHVSAVLVPVMAIGYVLVAIVVIVTNIELIPHVFKVIITDAFGIHQVTGGSVGAMIMIGVKRGLFSNEAGEGSAPNVAATAAVSHPVKQGLIQSLGVFTDTLLVCSCTAFIILISGLYQVPGLNGIALTQSALQSEIGALGPIFVAIAIFMFAFSSIIGNYYYGEANIRFITSNGQVMTVYRICSAGVMVIFGAVASFELVWNIIDFFMAFLTACNLIAIVLLGRYAFRLLDDYRQQKRAGIKEPTFHRSQFPELENELECWE